MTVSITQLIFPGPSMSWTCYLGQLHRIAHAHSFTALLLLCASIEVPLSAAIQCLEGNDAGPSKSIGQYGGGIKWKRAMLCILAHYGDSSPQYKGI